MITFNKHVSTSNKPMNGMEKVLKKEFRGIISKLISSVFVRKLGEEETVHFRVEISESLHKAHL